MAKKKAAEDTKLETGDDVVDGQQKLTASRILRLWDEGREDTVSERINYWMNYAFWRGAQWVWCEKGYVSDATIVPVTTGKKQREQATHNRVRPAVHTVISSAMKVGMSQEVLAQAADDYAHHGAQTGESLLRQKALDDDWEQLRERWFTACYLGGTAGIVTEWDKDAHDYGADAEGNKITGGDAFLDVLTIEDFVVEPGSPDAKRARWWIRKQVLPAEAVQAMYGLKEKPKEDAIEGGPFSEATTKSYSVLSQKRGTQVLTYFERPNALRPKGAIAVVVGKDIVWGEKSKSGKTTGPAEWGTLFSFTNRLNLEVGVCIMDPNKWTGESPVTDAISPQRQYNALWTKIHEVTHRTAGSKLMIDKRHAELVKNLSDDPEEPIYLTPTDGGAEAPKYLAPPQLPNGTTQQLEDLRNQIDDTLYTHAISRGQAGTNAPDSGYGLSILAENDATPTGRLLKESARIWANSSTNILELYSAKVKDKRKTIVTVRRSMAHPVTWDGASLAGQTRVIVPADSVLPKSHAGMMELAKNMMQMRPEWFQTPGQFLSFVMMPGVDNMVDVLDDDVSRADYENYRMADGDVMEVFDFDDHAKHIQQHNHFRKSPRYLSLDAKTRGIYDLHIQNHMSMQASKVGQQTMLGMMNPALRADPLLGGGMPQQPNDPSQLALPPSGAQVETPDVPQGV